MQTQHLTAGFIGLGLIGGSIARALKKQAPSTTVMAYMRSRDRLLKAQEDGAVDIILEGVGEPLRQCDIIFLCTPVEYNASYLEQIRPYLKPGAVITDVGSTKTQIHEAVQSLAMEESFIGDHEKIKNQRKDFQHKLSRELAERYDAVCVEDLNLKGMSGGLHLGKGVQDNGYGQFLSMLGYKLEERGKHLIKVDRYFASSKICSVCGHKKKELALSDRMYAVSYTHLFVYNSRNAASPMLDQVHGYRVQYFSSNDFPTDKR